MIERFKSQNAILRDSSRFLPVATNDLIEGLGRRRSGREGWPPLERLRTEHLGPHRVHGREDRRCGRRAHAGGLHARARPHRGASPPACDVAGAGGEAVSRPAAPPPHARRRGCSPERPSRSRCRSSPPATACLPGDAAVAPYECTFQGMSAPDRRAWADRLGLQIAVEGAPRARRGHRDRAPGRRLPRRVRPARRRRPSARPTLVVCGDSDRACAWGRLRRVHPVVLHKSDTRRFRCGLVGLKGEVAGRLLARLADDPSLVERLESAQLRRRARNVADRLRHEGARVAMRFFFPDSQDQIDPSFDFETEERSPFRVRQRDDRYAHEVLSPAPYAGMLVSKAMVDGVAAARAATAPSSGSGSTASACASSSASNGEPDRHDGRLRSLHLRPRGGPSVLGRRGDRLLRGLRLRRRHLGRPRHPRLRSRAGLDDETASTRCGSGAAS